MTDDQFLADLSSAICYALSNWLPEPLHQMAYDDAARAAIDRFSAYVALRNQALLELLDGDPPEPNEALRKLLTSPSPWDRDEP